MLEQQSGISRLDEVRVSRKEILEIVKQNKQKHDKILTDAIEGYWLDAEKTLKTLKADRLKEMKKQYQKNVKDFKKQISKDLDLVAKRKKDGPFTHLRKAYPEDHSNDYNSVIRKLELCVEDTVELDSNEFEQYIRNQWAWRNSFITTNCFYSAISGGYWGTGSLCGASSYSLSSSYSNGNIGLGTTNPTYSLNTNVDF